MTSPPDGRTSGHLSDTADTTASALAPAPAPGDSPPAGSASLWAERARIYPRDIRGPFRRLKWTVLIGALGIYYLLPWLRWDRGPGVPDQAILGDLAGNRLFIFGLELWPEHTSYFVGLFLIAALLLFLFSTLLGRTFWCGMSCPQTLWIDLFYWLERHIEGDRGKRIRLDKAPWTARKVAIKSVKYGSWVIAAIFTGGYFILYFVDAPTFVGQIITGEAAATPLWFVVVFAGSAYFMGGWAKEQFCNYMCPWPRFQSAMLDAHSLIVTYRPWRGDRPAPLRKPVSWEERRQQGFGDCIDCGVCVQVCPVGIDIRKGLQMECIGCALCIDGCNDVMTRIGRPKGLIAFDTDYNSEAAVAGRPPRVRLLRARTLGYAGMLCVVTLLTALVFASRPHMAVSVRHDRAPLFVALGNGEVRNAYTIKLSNMTARDAAYRISVDGITGAALRVAGQDHGHSQELVLTVAPDNTAVYRLFVQAPAAAASGRSTIHFVVVEDGIQERVVTESTFFAE